ncbi:Protein phosphatase 1 regulatory subunit 7 [Fukomys damarensis]|uniref:Protein phosphatase 1 regulatory subunit 7 n=1 Tax=Fukomys damarensis TaxID=885580 RepID=A0A091DTL9_FUKDA|nr:Protein phosphatase 1 regulatory subunit 7 [Fukomys damarensis]
MMEVDRRVESEESAEEEGKKYTSGTVADLSEQSLKDGVERGGEDPEEEHELAVEMETISLDRDAEDVDLNHYRIGLSAEESEDPLPLSELKCTEDLEELRSLRELDLYDNQIKKMENLEVLTELEILDISFNLLRNIEGIDQLTQLKKLFLVNNKISKIENIRNLHQLQMLELGPNRFRAIENIDTLTNLEKLQEFWMNDSLLECWSDLDELKGARSLGTVYLERPLQKDPQYRRKVTLALPSAQQITASFVRF